jgi:hypothetical protein
MITFKSRIIHEGVSYCDIIKQRNLILEVLFLYIKLTREAVYHIDQFLKHAVEHLNLWADWLKSVYSVPLD